MVSSDEDEGDDAYDSMLTRITDPAEMARIREAWDAPADQRIIAANAGAGGSEIVVFGKHTQRLSPASWLFDEVSNGLRTTVCESSLSPSRVPLSYL